MLASAHQGYIYQDVLGAYFVAQELAQGRGATRFHFDQKKTPTGIPDKFDDLVIYYEGATTFIQVKYSNEECQHVLTKRDFSSRAPYDLALFDLFGTWKALHSPGCEWRVCLAWDLPAPDDPILKVLTQLPDSECFLPGTICYRFDCSILWPEDGEVLSSWKALRSWSQSVDRAEFKTFLDCLVLELSYPKSTLLQDYSQGLEKLLARTIGRIGIGVYPNDHLYVRQVAESLCTITKRRRATKDSSPISCEEIANDIGIIQSYGGIEQHFPVDETVLVATPDRVDQVIAILEEHDSVILTAEPGAGKSWFIENLQNHLQGTTEIVKHYCYIALEDPLAIKRITVNILYGSLITQIIQNDEDLGHYLPKRYASNLEQLNILLRKIDKKTIVIVDGIDHIWRVYQKNRGGLTEDETTILQALAQLDCSNPNISLLVVSQPIEQLAELSPFYHCTLAPLPEKFVQELLEKHAIPNSEVEEVSLAHVIHEKSNGNALYCKYLIDHAITNKAHTSFDWIAALPPYEFNLKSYYQYLYEQIHGDTRVPYALCGADFSLTERELQEITYLGSLVSIQLGLLRPILKYMPTVGYSVYHESFKRFVIDSINSQGASVDHLIYRPLISWLEMHSFFESTKAYGHLLKLYYEVDSYDAIARTISIDFLDDSLYHAQPLQSIVQNHNLQKASLKQVDGFVPMIIIAEQSKIIYELEHISGNVLIKYLKAIQEIHDEEAMYRVLWDRERLLVSIEDAMRFLANQAYLGKEAIHWSLIPKLSGIPYEILGFFAVQLLHTKQYEEFDELIRKVSEKPEHSQAFNIILDEVEWWIIFFGEDWKNNTPYFQSILDASKSAVSTLSQAVDRIIANQRFVYDDNWEVMVRDLIILTKSSSDEEKEAAISTLSNYNWFRNWLIYLVKITELSQREHSNEELIDAFTYLVRDLKPFKGKPRVMDLYQQLPFIKKSFHRGLMLCNGNEELLTQCCELLERVTELTTSIQRSFSGPLTDEEYLEIVASYLPGEYVIDKYQTYFDPLGSRRVYSDVAEIAFQYAYILNSAGRNDEARQKYIEGIQALTGYGDRKDRTLSEILYSSVPYQQAYGTLDVAWFYEIYHMAMTVVTHTDGKSTSSYPIEWFKEFVKVYPDEALKFLICETIESKKANWHQESEFQHVLEEYGFLFTPTQWFFLCKSQPLSSSEKLFTYGLTVLNQIDEKIQDGFQRWLQSLPFILQSEGKSTYSHEVAKQFERQFGTTIKFKNENNEEESTFEKESPLSLNAFSEKSVEELLAFLETNSLKEEHTPYLRKLFSSLVDWETKKTILLQIAKSLKYERNLGKWLDEMFELGSEEWLYHNVCLFVFITDGWLSGLHNTHYLKQAYELDSSKTLLMLQEVLGYFLPVSGYAHLVSCNLIKSLSELQVDESVVSELIQTTFQLVKRRLPHPPNSEINESLYKGLEGFSRDEMVVALLIARLKTLTTEKTQAIIWSLIFIAQTAPSTIFRPFYWAFSHHTFLLPIHRAVLLQILKDYVDFNLIPDKLAGQFVVNYPTGFFLEDQYIRSFIDYKIELSEPSIKNILFEAHPYDKIFLPYTHIKYNTLVKHCNTLAGLFKTYDHKRDMIIEEYRSYHMQSEKLTTPIISLANASYEIVNSHFYSQLKDLTHLYYPQYICNLQFFFSEIIIQVGTLSRRPSFLPTPEYFPLFKSQDASDPLEHEDWVVLATIEREFFGEQFKPKQSRYSAKVLTFTEELTPENDYYARYLFLAKRYEKGKIEDAPYEEPICRLTINDTLEHSELIYVSPWIIRELGLQIDPAIHLGFNAKDEEDETVIKMISWKENYYGSIDDGTEVPGHEGVAVLIKSTWYNRLLSIFENKGRYILRQSDKEV